VRVNEPTAHQSSGILTPQAGRLPPAQTSGRRLLTGLTVAPRCPGAYGVVGAGRVAGIGAAGVAGVAGIGAGGVPGVAGIGAGGVAGFAGMGAGGVAAIGAGGIAVPSAAAATIGIATANATAGTVSASKRGFLRNGRSFAKADVRPGPCHPYSHSRTAGWLHRPAKKAPRVLRDAAGTGLNGPPVGIAAAPEWTQRPRSPRQPDERQP
jgi:hypothetical protein